MLDVDLISVLKREMEAVMLSENASGRMLDVDADRLLRYAHEDELASDGEEIAQLRHLPRALQICVPARTDRNIVVSTIRTPRMAEGEFPAFMACVSRLRSYLSESEQLELIAVVVGPPGACDESIWRGVARQLEQNEAIARVFVWLPPKSEDGWRNSAMGFWDRVVLKETSLQDESARDLAPIEGVLSQGELLPPERERWRPILTNTNLSAKERASNLLEALAAIEGAN